MHNWKPIRTAPKDGTRIWGWLYDSGIVLMHWMTAEQNCEQAGDGGSPDEYIACWVMSGDPSEDYSPKFWLPLDAIKPPPGVAWINNGHRGRWRDVGDGQ